MFQGWRVFGVAIMVFATSFVAPGQAEACACGGFVSPDSRLSAVEETALVKVDTLASGPKAQTLVLNLGLRADSKVTDAAFVMPVPWPAAFGLADPGLFDALDEVSKPKVQEDVEHYFDPYLPFFMRAGAPAGRTASAVVTSRVALGPYDIVTLKASDASAVRAWLRDNGFELPEALGDGLAHYLAQGWQIVAVKLIAAEGLQGLLPPMRIAFGSDEVVYPMRLSAHARNKQRLRVYVLADHRASITNPTPDGAAPTETFAGQVSSEDAPAFQTEFEGRRFLTRYDQEFQPAPNTADITVTAAPDDTPFRAVVHVVSKEPWPWSTPLCLALCCVLPVVAFGVFLFRSRAAKR